VRAENPGRSGPGEVKKPVSCANVGLPRQRCLQALVRRASTSPEAGVNVMPDTDTRPFAGLTTDEIDAHITEWTRRRDAAVKVASREFAVLVRDWWLDKRLEAAP
jgi:hypothetical protein